MTDVKDRYLRQRTSLIIHTDKSLKSQKEIEHEIKNVRALEFRAKGSELCDILSIVDDELAYMKQLENEHKHDERSKFKRKRIQTALETLLELIPEELCEGLYSQRSEIWDKK